MGVDALIHFTNEKPISEQELKEASYDLAAALPDAFSKSYKYSSFPIDWNDEEQHYTVDYWGRYYGPGYERGYFPEIYAAIRWIQNRFPKAKIYYYGDSGGFEDENLMTVLQLEELMEYWLDNGNQPYQRAFGEGPKGCRKCTKPLINVGGGGGKTFYSCMACKKRFVMDKELIEVEDF